MSEVSEDIKKLGPVGEEINAIAKLLTPVVKKQLADTIAKKVPSILGKHDVPPAKHHSILGDILSGLGLGG